MSFQLESPGPGGGLPTTARQKKVASGGAWKKGNILTVNASDEYAQIATTADPALNTMAAIALHDVGTGTGALYPIGVMEFPPGYAQAWAIREGLRFTAEYTGTLPATAGGSYGIIYDTDTRFKVDFSDTTNTRVKLVEIDWTKPPLSRGRVTVQFLAGYLLI
jgi:hypothetical protein